MKQIKIYFTAILFLLTYALNSLAAEEKTQEITLPTLSVLDCNSVTPLLPPNSEEDLKFYLLPNPKPGKSCFATMSGYEQTNQIATIGDIIKAACKDPQGIAGIAIVCAYNLTKTDIAPVKINVPYNTKPLEINLTAAEAEYAQVSLTINSSVNSIQKFQICYAPATVANFVSNLDCESSESDLEKTEWPKMILVNSTSVTIDKLTNDEEYVFKARAISANSDKEKIKELSKWSQPITATPEDSQYFSDQYDKHGPIQLDGCSQIKNSSSLFPLLGLLVLFLFSLRRKKSCIGLGKILFSLVILTASSSQAHLGQISIGFNGTPYFPNLDGNNEIGTPAAPYSCDFGNKKNPSGPILPLIGFDLNVHLTDAFGSLQLGGGIAYSYVAGHTLSDSHTCNSESGSPQSLHFFQVKIPQLTYILDNWVELVPIAPYVRGGLIMAGYANTPFSRPPDHPNKPINITFGWEAAAGFLFLLDVFAPQTASTARSLGVYDHTFLKFEVAYAPINNFGRGGLDLSSAWPNKDLPITLNFGLVVELP